MEKLNTIQLIALGAALALFISIIYLLAVYEVVNSSLISKNYSGCSIRGWNVTVQSGMIYYYEAYHPFSNFTKYAVEYCRAETNYLKEKGTVENWSIV